jgi:hypothetical protein
MSRFLLLAASLVLFVTAQARAADASSGPQLELLAKKVGAQLNGLSALFNRGPAQDVEVRAVVLGAKAVATGGDAPGAKLKIDLRLSGMQLQGGDFADENFSVEADLRRDGDLWICTKAMATPGMVLTRSGPVIGDAPQEPFNVTETVQAALVKIGAARPPATVMRDAVAKWVSENNALGADSPIGNDMGKVAEKHLEAGKNFGILLGPGLMKSGKATRIGVFCGQFYVVQYTDAQCEEAGLRPTTVVETTDAITARRRIPPDVEIGTPDFGAAGIDLAAGVKGTIPVRALRRLPEADYVIRLSYTIGSKSTSAYSHFGNFVAEKEKSVDFKFGPAGADAAKLSGPVVVFIDVCEMMPVGNGEEAVETISRTSVMAVDAMPGTGKVQSGDSEVREPRKTPGDPPTTTASAPAQTPAPPTATASHPAAGGAAAPAREFHSLQELVTSAPAEALQKLHDATTASEAIEQLNAYFAQNVKNKQAVLPIKARINGPAKDGKNVFRIGAVDTVVPTVGGDLKVRVWAYFPPATAPAEHQSILGSDITVTGVIGRCDFTIKEGLRLNIDLQESKIQNP